jgi:hypothetical protein
MDFSVQDHLIAKSLLDNNRFKCTICDSSKPLFIFEFDDGTSVSFNYKGWLCDWVEDVFDFQRRVDKYIKYKEGNRPVRLSHSYFVSKKIECVHVIACRLWLAKYNLLSKVEEVKL